MCRDSIIQRIKDKQLGNFIEKAQERCEAQSRAVEFAYNKADEIQGNNPEHFCSNNCDGTFKVGKIRVSCKWNHPKQCKRPQRFDDMSEVDTKLWLIKRRYEDE